MQRKKSLIEPAYPPFAKVEMCLFVSKLGSCLHNGDSSLKISTTDLVTGMS